MHERPDTASPLAPAWAARYRHVVVEGPIGAGKTSLARRLAQVSGAHLVLEQPDENPFLARFYRDRARYALQTQLFFLFQRVQQLRELQQLDLFHRLVVGDFLLDKDALFARLTLADDELKLYDQIHAQIAPQAPAPDLVVYLQAAPETLAERVARRGHATESGITTAYLRALSDSYTRFFHQYDAAPVLVVDTEHLNPIDRDDDFKLLTERIERMRGRREQFNLG
jgi:deoxyadenosine/deoxycytidine kinase